MERTIICYLVKDGKYLMLYRNKKENDMNKNKWIAVGGHIEENETKENACIREVYEETGLYLDEYKYLGQVRFRGDFIQDMEVFISYNFHGKMHECDEGTLKWFSKEDVLRLNMWEGDYLFLNNIFNEENIDLTLIYENGILNKQKSHQ